MINMRQGDLRKNNWFSKGWRHPLKGPGYYAYKDIRRQLKSWEIKMAENRLFGIIPKPLSDLYVKVVKWGF